MTEDTLDLAAILTRAERAYASAKNDAESLGGQVLPVVREHFNYDVPALIGAVQRLTTELDASTMQLVEHEGRTLRVIPSRLHDRLCSVRVASRQDGTDLLHCHFCGFCYPRIQGKATTDE